jgi:hypothetical protein
MNDSFTNQLENYLKQYDAIVAAKAEEARRKEAQAKKFLSDFEQVTKFVIEPAFTKVRDLLLKRNCPATIVTDPPPGMTPVPERYIGFYCSNDKTKDPLTDEKSTFRVYFKVHGGKIELFSTYQMTDNLPKRDVTVQCRLADITQSFVEQHLWDFVRAVFPSR